MSYEKGADICVDGFVRNMAAQFPSDYNVPEVVYVAVSKYKYRFDSDTLRVPLGIYFGFITENSSCF